MKFNLGDKVKIRSNGVIGIIISRGYNEYLNENDKQQSFEEYQIEADKYYQCNEDEIELYNPIIEEGKYLTKDIIDCKMFEELTGLLKPQEVKNVKVESNDPVNPFMKEYKKIVIDTMELCEKKNKDYGNATDKSFKQFGDVSYQVRCFDKWNRINTLLKNGKAEVSESLEDSLLDLANYLFLWVTSRRLKNEGDK